LSFLVLRYARPQFIETLVEVAADLTRIL